MFNYKQAVLDYSIYKDLPKICGRCWNQLSDRII